MAAVLFRLAVRDPVQVEASLALRPKYSPAWPAVYVFFMVVAGPVAESESPLAAYVIAEFAVGDSTWVETYASLATQATLEHGGEYLARGVVPETLEGSFDPDERLAILRFPDVDAARAWYSSETYSKALAATGGALRRRLFIVET